MIVSTMIERMRERMDDAVLPYETEDAVYFQWLNQAYLRIQQRSLYWGFLHNWGKIFDTAVGVQRYALLLVREIDLKSTYIIKSGETLKRPLYSGSYKRWITEQRETTQPNATPLELIRGEGDYWIVDPPPNDTYAVFGSWWSNPIAFVDENDEPLWFDTLHDLVWLYALAVSVPRNYEEKYSAQTQQEIRESLPSMMDELERRYLRPFMGARSQI